MASSKTTLQRHLVMFPWILCVAIQECHRLWWKLQYGYQVVTFHLRRILESSFLILFRSGGAKANGPIFCPHGIGVAISFSSCSLGGIRISSSKVGSSEWPLRGIFRNMSSYLYNGKSKISSLLLLECRINNATWTIISGVPYFFQFVLGCLERNEIGKVHIFQ